MIAVLQRVLKAEVKIEEKTKAKIKKGLVILLGINKGDTKHDAEHLVKKISNMRLFDDSSGNMNLSIKDINASALVISQFTLCADTSKGRRPSFLNAENPIESKILYDYFLVILKKMDVIVETGRFGADMNVELINNGPVTIIVNSQKT
tara:strand:- start:980 stop:1426 length:447 start_codon:yes stop_codon:yes gene_type:complete